MKFKNTWYNSLLVASIVGVLFSIFFVLGIFKTISYELSDRLFLNQIPDDRIVIVAIDDKSLLDIGRWPWKRSIQARLIKKITQASPRVIGYDVIFPEETANDYILANAISDAREVVLPVEIKDGLLLQSTSEIGSRARGVGFVNLSTDRDNIVRRATWKRFYNHTEVLSFVARVAQIGGEVNVDEVANEFLINFPYSPIDAKDKKFLMVSATDVLNDRVNLDIFANKYVFVGATAIDLHDNALIATSNGHPLSGVEIQATMLHTVLNSERGIQRVPKILIVMLILLISVIVAFLIYFVRLKISLPILLSVWFVYILLVIYLFTRGWVVDILWPSLTLFFSILVVALERKIASELQKREIKVAFLHYVSPSVVESILDNPQKLKLGGERKEMTVLFSDVRGFTTISEGLKPEKLVEIMNIYLSKMTDIVFKHEGVLDKYIGDAVMAFWNAPLDQDNHPQRAVDTALEMLDKLEKMNKDNKFDNREFRIGIGINTGDMVVGNMGSATRFDYTVIGDAVNLGARMEGLTKGYQVFTVKG